MNKIMLSMLKVAKVSGIIAAVSMFGAYTCAIIIMLTK